MNIRNLILISIIGLSLLLLVFRPYPFSRLPFFPIDGMEAVPASAGICLEIGSMQSFRDSLTTQYYTDDLARLYPFQQFHYDFSLFESVWLADSLLHRQLVHTPLWAVLQNGGLDPVNYLFILEMPSAGKAEAVIQMLESHPEVELTSTVFKKREVYKVKNQSGEAFSFSIFRNLVLFGRYPLLIEDAINQLKVNRKRFTKGLSFRKMARMPDWLRVYVRSANLPLLLTPFLNKIGKQQIDKLIGSEMILAVDVLLKKDGIRLTGQMGASANEHWAAAIKKQYAADQQKVAAILPDHTALVQWLSIDRPEAYEMGNSSSDFQKYIQPWLGDDAALVVTEPYSINLDAENFLLLATPDPDLAEHYIQKWGQASGEVQAYEYMTYNIRQLLTDDLLDSRVMPWPHFKNPFITFVGNYMVAAQSQQALEIWIDKYNAGQTLPIPVVPNEDGPKYQPDKTVSNLQVQQQTSPGLAKWWTHFRTDNARQLLVTYLRKSHEAAFNDQFNIGVEWTPMDFVVDQKGRFNGFLSHQIRQEKNVSLLWKTRLANKVIGQPTVITHADSRQFEVFLQDEKHILYLLDSGGNTIWKKQLDGPLLSAIHRIDYYKNDRDHFLFNTPGSIYLLNHQGTSVGNFPIRLRSRATNGVIAVDFDELRNYHFFVACRNGKIYGYQKTGSPLEGWPRSGSWGVKHPIVHFQKNEKDFLIALNDSGKMMVFNRRGKKRFGDIRFNSTFLSPPDYDDHDEAPRIVAVDKRGIARIVGLDGGNFKMALKVGDNRNVRFAFGDLFGDSRKDYIVSSGHHLAAWYYKDDGTFDNVFDIETTDPIDAVFPITIPGKLKQLTGTVSTQKGQINLYHPNGKRWKQFPLAGTTPFQIVQLYKSGENILIVGNGSSLLAYRLR